MTFLQILALIALVLFIHYIAQWFKKTRWLRLIKDTPTSKIKSAAQGKVELSGIAKHIQDSKLISPLTGRECVWYHYYIEEYQEKNDGAWEVIRNEVSTDLFALEDETGQCIVNPEGATVQCFLSEHWYHGDHFPGKLPTPRKRLIISNNEKYRYTERWIEHDEPLFVHGEFYTQTATAEHLPLKEELKQTLQLYKSYPKQYLKKYNISSLEQIDQHLWDKIRTETMQQIIDSRANNDSITSIDLLRKPANRKNEFLLSSYSEEELVQQYKKNSVMSLLISIISATFAFPILINLIFKLI